MSKETTRLLLLVSNKLQASRLTTALKPDGYQLETLVGLDYPLPTLSNNLPDLAILWFSYALPEALSDLKNLVTQVFELQNPNPTPVLMIIDQYGAHWVEPAFKLGVTDILTRPIHPLVLRQRVRLILQARQTELAIARYQSSEKALRQEEERFRTVADFTYDWEYWSDPKGALIYNSPSCERITGYTPQSFLEDPNLLTQIVIPEDRELFRNHLQNELHTEKTYNLDFQINTRSGEKRWIGHVCQQVHGNDGRVLGRRISNRDITQRKLVENTLVRSERLTAIGRMAASLSHEINNPLQTMYNSIELLQNFSLDEGERQQYLQIVHDEIERLMKINTGILDFSRDPKINFQQTLIQPIIEHAIFLSSTQLKESKVQVVKNLPADLPQILASPEQLAQVFLNIMINAAEHMTKGGTLHISACANNSKLEISFADTGSGISPADLDLIFDPFYTTNNEGTGLGLAISKRIIQRHYGDISVCSKPGSGSVFIVSLPLHSIAT